MDEDLFSLIKESSYKFTNVEQVIANYFLQHQVAVDINDLAQKLYVSKSSITRFCKKLGLNNYKELNFLYRLSLNQKRISCSDVLISYEKLIQASQEINEQSLDEICKLISQSKMIYFLGKGFNSFAGFDLQLKFAKIGKQIQVVNDDCSILLTVNLAKIDELLVVSNDSDETLKDALQIAIKRQLPIILITANKFSKFRNFVTTTLLLPTLTQEDEEKISPQIPLLIQFDLIYEKYLESKYKES